MSMIDNQAICLQGCNGHHRMAYVRVAMALGLICSAIPVAEAFEIPVGDPDWKFQLDNTVTYGLGMRAMGIDDKIGNNPAAQASDYKFPHAGDIVTNRFEDLVEFDAVYQGSYGLRTSALLWKDFAYDDKVKSNPGTFAGPATYSQVLGSAYGGNRYSSYTRRYFVEGAELQDAFLFGHFDAWGRKASVKAGRVVEYWGNSVFFGAQGVDYGQNAANGIKAAAQPGTPVKALSIPRAQLNGQVNLTPEFSVAAQYFMEHDHVRLPEGGTYLGAADFLFNGPNSLLGIPRTGDRHAGGLHANYGVKATWTPSWLRGTLAGYYRHFDDPSPSVLGNYGPAGLSGYHLGYGTNNTLYGLSLDKDLFGYSFGFETSYRRNATLVSRSLAPAAAKGDAINVVVNALAGLTPTPFYDTGTFLAEIAFTHKLSVTENRASFNGCDSAVNSNRATNCATNNFVALAVQFNPQWPQVLPGVDLDMPIFAMYGIHGNSATTGASIGEKGLTYSVGLHALVRQRYNMTLQYNGYHFPHDGISKTPNGAPYYTNYGFSPYNDKNWLSLTLSTTF